MRKIIVVNFLRVLEVVLVTKVIKNIKLVNRAVERFTNAQDAGRTSRELILHMRPSACSVAMNGAGSADQILMILFIKV